ncbi:chemotaxis protein CheX [Thauera aminoaromatica]|uniref:Chemotaxis protein CheC n=1 Tax=Thauera aminoaromatica TaxID=164330 RepID=A0A5C7SIU0_THASP|nr:chemotaxis protein CheX [Thauera aminoaromatica]TXH82876.1 MAG: chemotaxis protein CheC [Thauera aminoaromatica]
MDALTEAFNLSLGEAASTFSAIVREEIELSVPTIEIVSREELTSRLESARPAGATERLCRINQHFCAAGGFQTDALLLFPEHGSLEIVRRMLGDDTAIEHITELEQDALAEIGNIIINSCMSSLASLFGSEMHGSLPRVQSRTVHTLLDDKAATDVILVARIGMSMAAHNLHGFVLFIMDVPSIEHFMDRVSRYFKLPLHDTGERV